MTLSQWEDAEGGLRLLSGPARTEGLAGHLGRLGRRPTGGDWLIGALEASGLRGHGGAGFPVGRKWRSIADRQAGAAVVVNGSEGEPASHKDRLLMEWRPHLVLDGAVMAAESLGAAGVTVVLARPFEAARAALEHAIAERRRSRSEPFRIRVVSIPHRYVGGESSAVVNRLNGGRGLPTTSPPSPRERGLDGRPTLVQNVETCAHIAQIGRFGADRFRAAGTAASPGTALFTVSGAVTRPSVVELPYGSRLSTVVSGAGGYSREPQAVLMGGYFGAWLPVAAGTDMTLDEEGLLPLGGSVGCGVVSVLPVGACGLVETAAIFGYLAAESAGQCGPCVHGLASVAEVVDRLAGGKAAGRDLERIQLWSSEIAGRGACNHPDGALGLLASGLRTFADDVLRHTERGPCLGAARRSVLPPVPARRAP